MINKIKNHKTIIIIPARWSLKDLIKCRDIQGKPMIQRVVEKAKEYGFSKVIVATDSKEIFKLCKKNNFEVMMSLQKHKVELIGFMKPILDNLFLILLLNKVTSHCSKKI